MSESGETAVAVLARGVPGLAEVMWERLGPVIIIALLFALIVSVTRASRLAAEGVREPGAARRGQDLAEDLVRPLSLLFALAVGLGFVYRGYLWDHYRSWFVMCLLIVLASTALAVWLAYLQSERLRRHHIGVLALPRELARMDLREFEVACADLFREQGYAVQFTPVAGEGGADILLQREGCRYVALCEHHLAGHRVGAPEVQKLLSAMWAHRASKAFLLTSGELTNQATSLARSVPDVEIWQRPRLAREAQVAVNLLESRSRHAHRPGW